MAKARKMASLQVCRTCLEEITDSNFLSLNDESNKMKEGLVACVPELKLDLIPNANICIYCANALQTSYDFKQRCLEVEMKILSHIKQNNVYDLVEIKQEPDWEDTPDAAGLEMEVIFINEDANVQLNNDQEVVTSFLKFSHDVKFDTPIKKEINVKVNPNGVKKFNCKLCKYSTIKNRLLELHVKTHKVVKPYSCSKCDYTTSYKQCLVSHSKICKSGDSKSLHCTHCDYITSNRHEFLKHVEIHKPVAHKCSKCDYETLSEGSLRRHMKSHKLQPKRWEQIKVEDSNILLTSKQPRHTILKCTFCKYVAGNKTTLKHHISTHTGEKPYACTQCDYKAIQKGNLKQHLASRHNIKLSY